MTGRSRTAQRPQSPLLQSYDPSLRQTPEAVDSEALQRLLQVEDRLRYPTTQAQSPFYPGLSEPGGCGEL